MSAADDPVAPAVRILLDVDGVLNAVSSKPGDHWTDWRKKECMGFRITHSPAMAQRLLGLAQRPGVELRWMTTWEHRANEWIGPLFDWPEFAVVERHDIREHGRLLVATSGWWKFDEAKALYEADGVPFVWVDDDLGPGDDGASDWIASLNGAALGVRPDSTKGLTPRLLDEIEAFVVARTDGNEN